jgi:hypothetical protein
MRANGIRQHPAFTTYLSPHPKPSHLTAGDSCRSFRQNAYAAYLDATTAAAGVPVYGSLFNCRATTIQSEDPTQPPQRALQVTLTLLVASPHIARENIAESLATSQFVQLLDTDRTGAYRLKHTSPDWVSLFRSRLESRFGERATMQGLSADQPRYQLKFKPKILNRILVHQS